MKAQKILIIAEAGVNHNGSTERALKLVDAAAAAGADVVKFQSFRAEDLVSAHAPKAAYQEKATGAGESQLAMVKRLELDETGHRAIAAHCRERNVIFLSTPFDIVSMKLLVDMGVPALKISSGDATNAPLLRAIGNTGLPAILSTGMCTLADVEAALGVLAAGYLSANDPTKAFRSARGQAILREKVRILHCTTEYPSPFEDVHLRAMGTLASVFGLPVGLSDHTQGIAIPIAAVARGAVIIEKHFTLDRALPGPDHKASLEPPELAAMVAGIRAVEAALGNPEKRPAPSELANITIARRSLVAAVPIRRGEIFSTFNLAAKRPGTGISAMRYDEWIGKEADRDYERDELIGLPEVR